MVLLSVPEADSEHSRIQQYLGSVAQALRERGYTARALITGSGAVRTILDVSESEGVDLIMLSTHGRGNLERKAAVGSVTDRVIDAAPCPVFLSPI